MTWTTAASCAAMAHSIRWSRPGWRSPGVRPSTSRVPRRRPPKASLVLQPGALQAWPWRPASSCGERSKIYSKVRARTTSPDWQHWASPLCWVPCCAYDAGQAGSRWPGSCPPWQATPSWPGAVSRWHKEQGVRRTVQGVYGRRLPVRIRRKAMPAAKTSTPSTTESGGSVTTSPTQASAPNTWKPLG